MSSEPVRNSTGKKICKASVALLLVMGIVLLIVFRAEVQEQLKRFLERVEELGFLGGVLFAFVYAFCTVAFIPGSILTLGAGFIFTKTNGDDKLKGTLVAASVVFIGASVGATLAAILARYVFRDAVTGWASKYKIFNAINAVVGTKGFFIVFLLRLSPAIPFNALNYILGITAVKMRDYIMALIGLLPGTIAFCFIGSTLTSLTEEPDPNEDKSTENTIKIVLFSVGAVSMVFAIVMISKYAKKELAKHLDNKVGDVENQAEHAE